MLKTTFKKEQPKSYRYCDYESFNNTNLHKDLENKLNECSMVYKKHEETFVNVRYSCMRNRILSSTVLRGNH